MSIYDSLLAKAINGNGGGSGSGASWDAVIRLVHANNTGYDIAPNLTPSIVEGSYDDLMAKVNNGGCPCILVEYYHPYGIYYSALMGYITYATTTNIVMQIAGYSALETVFKTFGVLVWTPQDEIHWD